MVRGGGGGGGGGGELKNGSTSMSNLPEEILIEIFSRLPVRSLLRFRCISKDYCNLIGDPHFITHHFHHSPNNLATFFSDDSTSDLISHPTTLSSNDTRVYKFTSFRHQFCITEVVGCCNGIVCLRGCVARLDSICMWNPNPATLDSLCIWNPATQEVKYVPDAPISFPNTVFDIRFSGFGFGLDPIHNDYKVVRIVKFSREEERSLSVYSLSTGEWRELGKVSTKERRNIFFNGAFVNGAVHWVQRYEDLESVFILSFDMVLEKFKEIPEHDYGKDDKLFAKNIGELGGYLSVVDTYYKGYLEIWVMKEYGVNQSWTKLFTLHDPIADLMVIQIHRNEVVLWDFLHSRLILYHPKSGTKRYIKLDGMGNHFMVFPYMENLVSLRAYKGA